MDLHLFATDVSALELLKQLGPEDSVTRLIVPSNRLGSEKIARLIDAADLPIYEQRRRKPLDPDLPSADAAISWLYSQIIDAQDLARYPVGMLNMHGGTIPEYRGANVLQWAIINGEKELGITWHELVEEVDAGPIWVESRIPIPPTATAVEMRAAMIVEALRLFPKAWARFRNKLGHPRIPKLDQGRVWPSRKPEDGRIAPGWPGGRVRDMVRALCSPWPPATVCCDGSWVPVGGVLKRPEPGTIPYRTAEGTLVYLRRTRTETAS